MSESKISAYEVFQHVMNTHTRPQDFEEGDLEDRIYKHNEYELKSVPLNKIKTGQWSVDSHAVDEYKERLTHSEAPPIVITSGGTIIDGTHRAEAHLAAGKTHINAYVGVPKKRK